MTRLKGVVIGAGYFSQFHLDAWSRMDDVDIAAICDVNEASAVAAATNYNVPETYVQVTEMLDTHQPDFVDIITRPDSHLQLVREAVTRNVAVICQKPLAPTFNDAKELVAVAEAANVPLMVHENFRFQPWYREIKRLLEAGVVGSTIHSLSFRMRTGDGFGERAYVDRQPYFRTMPRFLLHETGVHFIDTFRFLAGEVAGIQAILRRLNSSIQGEDAALVTLHFKNGATGTWDADRYHESTAEDPRYTFGTLHVECDGGAIRLDEEGRLFVKPIGDQEREHPYQHTRRGFAGDCVYSTQRHFIESLRSGTPFETSGRDYLKTLQLVEDAYASATQAQNVSSLTPSLEATASQVTPTSNDQPVQGDRRTRGRRMVDLSQPIQTGMRGVDISVATTIRGAGWNSTTLSLYSHCGTHMDAPKHFLGEEGATIDQQSLETCCGTARIVDLTPVQPRELISAARLLSAIDDVQPGDRLLLRTDWSHRMGTDAYRNELPRISEELATWMVANQIALIGVEAPSVADVNDLAEVTAVHQTLFRGGVVIVEGLVNLDQLTQSVVEFIALPLRVTDGDGSPVRAIAIEDSDS